MSSRQESESGRGFVVGMLIGSVVLAGYFGPKVFDTYEEAHSKQHEAHSVAVSTSEAPTVTTVTSTTNQSTTTEAPRPTATSTLPSLTAPASITISRPPTTASTPEPAPTVKPTLPTSPSAEYMVAQTFIVGFDASNTSPATILAAEKKLHFGGIYFTYTKDAAKQGFNKAFFAKLSQAAGKPMIVASDEEGGIVERESYDFKFPSAKDMAKMSGSQIEALGKRAGAVMSADGVTLDLAPVLDVDNGLHNGAISSLGRSFGGSPANIATKAGYFMRGLQASGIQSTLKHFPGIGRATPDSDTDSHKAYSPPLSSLQSKDLLPYVSLLPRASVVMLSNEYVTGLDTSRPASICPKVVELLRKTYNFPRIITTDDLHAIDYDGQPLAHNITASVQAGVTAPLFGFKGAFTASDEASISTAIHNIANTVSATQIAANYNLVLQLKTA